MNVKASLSSSARRIVATPAFGLVILTSILSWATAFLANAALAF